MIAPAFDQSNGPQATPAEPGQEPFAQIPKSILRVRSSDLSPKAKLVYMAIVDRIGANGKAWPGYLRIAADTGLHRDSARRAVEELIAARLLIKIQRGVGLSNMYAIPDSATLCSEHPVQPAPGAACTPPLCSEHTPPVQAATQENKTQEQDPGTRPKRTRSTKSKRSKYSEKDAEPIYQAFPKHVGKADALKAIVKVLVLLDERGERDPVGWLLDRVKKYAAAVVGQDRKFIPYPATWMNKARYDDDESEWRQTNGNGRAARASREWPEPPKRARVYRPGA